jgi:hypothetical protein
MDLSRAVYSRDLKIAARRALEWRAKGELSFPGIGRRGTDLPAVDDARRIAELERKIGQLTMENDFFKKPCGISGTFTRQRSSMAGLPV